MLLFFLKKISNRYITFKILESTNRREEKKNPKICNWPLSSLLQEARIHGLTFLTDIINFKAPTVLRIKLPINNNKIQLSL